jgi:Tfp pilus assembly protein PilN
MEQKINEKKARYQWLQDMTANRPVLDILSSLTSVLGRFRDVEIENVSIDGNEIHLDGHASSFQTVDRLKGGFEKDPIFQKVNLVGAKMDNRKRAVTFNFVLEMKP